MINSIHTFQVERNDGAKAYKEIGMSNPDLIIVNLAQKASHGIQTIEAVQKRKRTQSIPIYFVQCDQKLQVKVQQMGKIIPMEELERILS